MCRLAARATILCLFFTVAPSGQAQIVGSDLSGPEGQQLLHGLAISSAATAVPIVVGASLWTSADATVQGVGLGLVAAGLVLGPSTGSWYLDDSRRALIGLAIRGAGAAAFATGFGLGFLHDPQGDTATIALSSSLISISAIVLSYGFAFNFVNMRNSIRDARVQVAAAYDQTSQQLVPALVLRF